MANLLTELQPVLQKKGGGVNLDCDYIGKCFFAYTYRYLSIQLLDGVFFLPK